MWRVEFAAQARRKIARVFQDGAHEDCGGRGSIRCSDHFGCAITRRYGFNVVHPCGYFAFAASSETLGGINIGRWKHDMRYAVQAACRFSAERSPVDRASFNGD
jgi:hypothetical protein